VNLLLCLVCLFSVSSSLHLILTVDRQVPEIYLTKESGSKAGNVSPWGNGD